MYFEKSLLNLWPGSGSWSLAEDKKGNYYTASAKKFELQDRYVSLLKQYTALLALDHFNLTIFLQNTEGIPHCQPLCLCWIQFILFGQDWEATARKSPRSPN